MQFGGILLTQMSVERISDKVGFKIENEALLCLAIRKLLDLHDNQKKSLEYLTEKMNQRWIPISERLPEDTVNPITRDAYVYPVTVDLGGVTDTRYYSFCRGHWYNQSPKELDELVIAWQERPEPYRPE